MDKIVSKRDFREQIIKWGYPYYVCNKCGCGLFILTQPSDNIFPDVICRKCGNIYLELKEGDNGNKKSKIM